jgi:hypothetical protein
MAHPLAGLRRPGATGLGGLNLFPARTTTDLTLAIAARSGSEAFVACSTRPYEHCRVRASSVAASRQPNRIWPTWVGTFVEKTSQALDNCDTHVARQRRLSRLEPGPKSRWRHGRSNGGAPGDGGSTDRFLRSSPGTGVGLSSEEVVGGDSSQRPAPGKSRGEVGLIARRCRQARRRPRG